MSSFRMPNQAHSLDPRYVCIRGQAVRTCPDCAGNAPRETMCSSCNGSGLNIFNCTHCNPAALPTAARGTASSISSTPESYTPSSTSSLSRSSSTAVSVRNEPNTIRPWNRTGDGADGSGGGGLGPNTNANTPRNI